MRTVIFDTNVYRACKDERFAEILRREAELGVYAVADSWTINELVAGLATSDSRERGSYLAGVRRLERRSLVGGNVILPAEAQARHLLFGEDPQDQRDAIQAAADCAREAALTPEHEWSPDLRRRIAVFADAMDAQERWFAIHFSELSEALANAARESGATVEHELRAHIQSESTLRADAVATITRAYSQSRRELPNPIPERVIDIVLEVFRPGFVATALALEKVCCEGASLERTETRNLMWDQEIAHNLGQEIGEHPTLIVTDDKFFRRAARTAGRPESVLTLAEYEELLCRPPVD